MRRRSFLAAVAALTASRDRAVYEASEGDDTRSFSHRQPEPTTSADHTGIVNVRSAPYNAKGNGVTDDTHAFVAAKAASNTLYVPPGVYKVAGFDGSNVNLVGAGRHETTLQGDGDIITNATRFNVRGVTLRNIKVRGKLISVTDGPDVGRSKFTDVEFGMAARHVSVDRTCVDWCFEDCTFNDASDISRSFKAAWAFKEIGCYSWYNRVGLKINGGSTISSFGCVYEFNNAQAVILSAVAGGTINNVMFQGVHFESNGNAGPTESVRLETRAAERIRNVAFNSCTFLALKGDQHVYAITEGGGSIARISFRDVFASATLMNAGFRSTFDNVEMNTGTPPVDALIVESLLLRARDSSSLHSE